MTLVVITIKCFSFNPDDGTTEKVLAATFFWSYIRGGGGGLGSKLRRDTVCLAQVLLWFSSILPGECWDSNSIRPGMFPSKSFPLYYSLSIILPYHVL
jgi:hypothetical protein